MKKIFIAALALCALYSCKKNDPEPEVEQEVITEVDLNDLSSLTGSVPVFQDLDPSTVSENVVFTNATRVSGSPSSTSDVGTPVLYDDSSDDLRVAQGSDFKIPLSIRDGEVAGYYVQIDGADDYFDIVKTNTSTQRIGFDSHTKAFGRITADQVARVGEDDDVVEIEIPSSIQPGKFCVLICVYNEEGLVSLPITRCVEVQAFGGAGAEFIVDNEWTLDRFTSKEVYNGEEELNTIKKGEWDEWSGTTSIFCEETFDYQDYDYTSKDRLDEFTFNFTSNGGMEFVIMGEDYTYDYEQSGCQTELVYVSETYNDVETGAWSYNASTQTMTMLFDDYTEEDGYYSDPYFIDFKAQEINNQLVLSYFEDYGDGDSDLYVFYFDKK